jgi:hypothetical protein
VRVLIDYEGRAIRLTAERQKHIVQHPEMVGLDEELVRALAAPERVVVSVTDADTRLYYRYLAQTLVGSKYLCVVAKVLPADAFVITAYLTDKVKKGRVLWPSAV